MPISHKKKIIFVHIPKNAGTSIITSEELDFSSVQHVPYSKYKKAYPEFWSSYLKVAIVRNPWDRFVSCYEYSRMLKNYWHSNDGSQSVFGPNPDYLCTKNVSFENLVHKFYNGKISLIHPGWASQSHWICDGSNIMVDKLFRYEEIGSNIEFEQLFGKIERRNQSSRSHVSYKDYYLKPELVDMIGEMYKNDVKNFGYSF